MIKKWFIFITRIRSTWFFWSRSWIIRKYFRI